MSEFDVPAPITPPSIRRRSEAERDADDVSFQALRSLGIAHTQDLSGRVWTDYNLHDPGVTILEAVCYALTELAYRADLPVPDHLARPDGTIDFERQALLRPDDILRCRPTTANDYRRVLLDEIDDLADARFSDEGKDDADSRRVPGLHRLSLRLADRGADDQAVQEAARRALEVYRGVRTVGEDLDEAVASVTPTMCVLSLTASISGMRDPADIVAEIYRRCADRIAGLARVRSLAELVVIEGRPLEQVLDGPRTKRGIIEEQDLPPELQDDLPVSDLRELVLEVEGVMEVMEFGIAFEGGRRAAPLLRVPGDGSHQDDIHILERISLLRRGVAVPLDARAVASRHAHRFRPPLAAGATHAEFERVVRPPTGRFHPPEPFRSVQEDFPVIYGLGRRGAGGQGRGRAAAIRVEQMRGYLTLFDQLLANTGQQLNHIKDLFAVDGPPDQTYWRHILDDEDSPGVRALQKASHPEIQREVYDPFDDAATRRGQVLDHLLALYGETCPQNTLRQFLDHLDSGELAEALVHNKTQYLRHILTLSRDRAAGFDVGEDLWRRPRRGEHEPTTGLQAKIALLLGFRRWWARPLTTHIATWIERHRGQASSAKPVSPRPEHDATWALTWRDHPEHTGGVSRKLEKILADPGLQDDLFAYAVNRERFRWQPDAKGDGGRLLLTDVKENRRELDHFKDEAEAGEFAQRLRRKMLQVNCVCDGFHIVEHILLRPRRGDAAVDVAFHGLQVTFVFPAWTARTSRDAFRAFAEETVEINCPAHVDAACLWLDLPKMRRFETLFATWTGRLRTYARSRTDATRARAAAALDRASAELADLIRAERARQAEGG